MTWQLSGRSVELCSCEMLCPCWLGPDGNPDQGWCAGAFAFDIERGASDGADLSGTRVALTAEWPGNFFGGNGTARLYLGDGATTEQRRELEAIFMGKKGGLFEALWPAVIQKWLPSETTKIDIAWGDTPTIDVGNVAQVKMTPLKDQAGRPTRVEGAPAQGAFQITSMDLASSKGSKWADPNLRPWQGDSGTLHRFDWKS
jgi:hypothetical protein